MNLRYLIANNAWAFVFGDSIVPVDGHHLHESRAVAAQRARGCGIGVNANGSTYTL